MENIKEAVISLTMKNMVRERKNVFDRFINKLHSKKKKK